MTLYIDPECVTCHGSGKVMGGDEYHDCPGCRLASRYVTRYCDGCSTEQPIVGMTFLKGELTRTEYAMCADCTDKAKAAHEASVEAAWRELRESGADELTLRAMAGDR